MRVTDPGAPPVEDPPMNSSRARTSIPVEFQAGGNRGTGQIDNIGAGGLFIGTGTIPDQGEPVSVRFSLPGESPIAVTGLVWWTTKDLARTSSGRQGFGLIPQTPRVLDATVLLESRKVQLLAITAHLRTRIHLHTLVVPVIKEAFSYSILYSGIELKRIANMPGTSK